MINVSKIALIAAIATVGIASPVFAQSFNPGYGTGNVGGYSYGAIAHQQARTALRDNGLQAYAMVPRASRQSGLRAYAYVPRTPSAAYSNNPADTGGGSTGYNQMLLQY